MALTAIFFYLFALLAIASATMVIVTKNPVHAVLFLILTFFNAAGLFGNYPEITLTRRFSGPWEAAALPFS